MKTTVIHVRDCPSGWKQDPLYVYIGRPYKWGNPFAMQVGGTNERTRVLEDYYQWMQDQVFLFKAIAEGELDGKFLVCYCKPEPCHGDLLAEIANATHKPSKPH